MTAEDLAANEESTREPAQPAPRGLRSWLNGWPSLCAACGMWQRSAGSSGWGRPALCDQCMPEGWVSVPLGPSPFRTPSVADAWAAVTYASPWDGWVHALKFRSEPRWAEPMAALCASATLSRWRSLQAQDPAEPKTGTWLIPVPLGIQRLRERGYNQAWELARRMSMALQLPAIPNALLRLRETRPQSTLGRAARATNLADAFAVHPQHQRALAGADVLLVDDVWTTGVTAEVCASLMRAAGVRRVRVCVFAYAPPPDRGPAALSREP